MLRAAGAVVAAVDRVMSGKVTNAFCAVRPPGHHAEPTRAMGFCMFNNVAIGALHARARHGLKRIAVVDFDVHHGNGTQAMFEDDEDLFFASSHQMPLYPGTGRPQERGRAHNIVNAALDPGAGSHEFRQAWDNTRPPRTRCLQPRLHPDQRRLRRPPKRPAREPEPDRSRLRLGDGKTLRHREGKMRRPHRLNARRRLRPQSPGRFRKRACEGVDGWIVHLPPTSYHSELDIGPRDSRQRD